MLLFSNNPKVINDDSPQFNKLEKMPIQGDHGQVLIAVRDKIHKGHKLLSHPLSGSVKPNETPYKSILVSKMTRELDLDGLAIIEHSVETFRKLCFNEKNWYDEMDSEILADFAEIDYSLIKSAIDNLV